MKNKTALVIGGVIVFIIILAVIGSSGSNNSSTQTASNNQPSLCNDIASLKNQATTVNFKELDKDPDSFKGEIVKFTGQILQIQESNGYGVARLAVTKESYGWSLSDVVYVEYQGHTDAVQDDVVTAYGQLTGSKTYESQAHFQITIPSMTACVIEKGTGATATQTSPATQSNSQKTTTSQISAAAAQYAINNVQANWNNNALLTAEDYQNTMHLSPKAIYDQLTSSYGAKFTVDEANYAIQHLSN